MKISCYETGQRDINIKQTIIDKPSVSTKTTVLLKTFLSNSLRFFANYALKEPNGGDDISHLKQMQRTTQINLHWDRYFKINEK